MKSSWGSAALWLAFGLLALPARADLGAVVSEGKLSDRAFYRMIACGAALGQPCATPYYYWPPAKRRHLTLAVTTTDPNYPAKTAKRISLAINAALSDLNGLGADFRIERLTDGQPADISIRLLGIDEGRTAINSGIPDLDGAPMTAGYVYADIGASNEILHARIVFAADIGQQNVDSIILEEITQSLGLFNDIENPFYQETSIFAESGDAVVRIIGQDAKAILHHYPPKQ